MSSKSQLADEAMQKIDAMLNKEAAKGTLSTKETRERTRKILSAIQQIVDVVEGVAELSPYAKAAVGVFVGVIRLETNRRENNEQIVVVCYNMGVMIHVLRFLDARVNRDEDLSAQIEAEVERVRETMLEFGDFADLYYNKLAKHPLVRFLRSGGFKEKLADFVEQFAQHRRELEFLLMAQLWGMQVQNNARTEDIQSNTKLILQRLDTPTSDSEKKLQALIDQQGGPDHILHDRATFDSFTRAPAVMEASAEPITIATRSMLLEDLDELLLQNKANFDRKLDSVHKELAEAIARSTTSILHRFDEGPHDLIKDPDIKMVWKDAGWKLTIKTRYFGEALFGHYTSAADQSSDDIWALDILSKVIYYPAIGEAIDEDSSGSLSVHEVNHFLAKNTQGYPTPVWLAYWAVGWRYTNSLLTDRVCELLDELASGSKRFTEPFKSEPQYQMLNHVLAGYRDTIACLQCLATWNDYNDDGMDALEEDISESTGSKLRTIAETICESEAARMKTELVKLDYKIDDPELLTTITNQAGLRIEQVFWSLLECVLQQHVARIRIHYDPRRTDIEELVVLWQTHDQTLTVLVVQLYSRYKSLQRSWRSQKLDVELEAECYAGGFFYGWYQESEKPGQNIIKTLEAILYPDDSDAEDDADDDEEAPDEQSGKTDEPTNAILAAQIAAINERLNSSDALLRQLLAAVSALAPSKSPNAPDMDSDAFKPGSKAPVSQQFHQTAPERGEDDDAFAELIPAMSQQYDRALAGRRDEDDEDAEELSAEVNAEQMGDGASDVDED